MKVRDVMTRKVDWVSPDAPVAEIAQLMKGRDVGSIPVCDAGGVKGIITDSRITL